MVMDRLWVEFVGEVYEVTAGLTFGRRADLVLDDANQFMHRIVGAFVREGDLWWIENRASKARISVFGSDGTRVELAPGARVAVAMPTGTLSFLSGPTPYQLTFSSDSQNIVSSIAPTSGEFTIEFGTPLSRREREFLATFAQRRISGEGEQLLSFAEVAAIWDVSPKTVENTMSRVRAQARDNGIRAGETLDQFVTHLLAHGQLGLNDLLAIEVARPDAFS